MHPTRIRSEAIVSMTTGTATALSFVILVATVSAQTVSTPRPVALPRTTPPQATPPQATPPQATPPQATPPQAPKPSAAPISADYRLVAGDKLRVEVYKDTQLSQALQVRPDGKITLPLLGDIAAAGKTPTELRDTLTAALREYITNPVVTVIVVETTPGTVFVMGEVNRPGAQAINGPISILQVLAMA